MSESDSWFLPGTRISRRVAPRLHGILLGHGRGAGLAPLGGRGHRGRDPEDREGRSSSGSSSRTARGTRSRSCVGSRPTAARSCWTRSRVDYHETIMAAAGHQAEEALAKTVKEKAGAYIAVVEGSIPRRERRLLYDRRPGRPSRSRGRCAAAPPPRSRMEPAPLRRNCPRAAPKPHRGPGRRRRGSGRQEPDQPLGVPGQRRDLTGAHRLLPHLQALAGARRLATRPLFAYGKAIHDNCERRAHFDAGQYVEAWGDEATARATASTRWLQGAGDLPELPERPLGNGGTNWPIGCGTLHRLRGARLSGTEWTPFYAHLQGVPVRRGLERGPRSASWHGPGGGGIRRPRVMSLGKRWLQAEHHPAARERAEEAQREPMTRRREASHDPRPSSTP